MGVTDRPSVVPLWLRSALAILLLPGMVAGLFPYLIVRGSWRLPLPLGPARWLGLVPLAVGLTILGLTISDFATRGNGTLAPWDPPRRLVHQRLYAWVRNPMYLGVLTAILGEAVLWTAGGLCLYLGVVATAFHIRVIAYEEPTLRRQFGAAFTDYLARVPRWLPRPPGNRPQETPDGRGP